MSESVDVDISGAVKTFYNAGVNVLKAVPQLLARLSKKGEGFMKVEVPIRTGNLQGKIHAHPTILPTSVAAGTNYHFLANVRSRRPGFIEKTVVHIKQIIPHESDLVIKNALKGMDK